MSVCVCDLLIFLIKNIQMELFRVKFGEFRNKKKEEKYLRYKKKQHSSLWPRNNNKDEQTNGQDWTWKDKTITNNHINGQVN